MKINLPDFKKLSTRERLMVGIGAAFLFFVASDRLVVGPWLDYGVKLQKEIRVLEKQIAGQRKLLSRRDQIQSDIGVYQQYLVKGGSAEVEMAAILKEVEDLAKKSSVSLEEVRPIASVNGETFYEYGFDVNFSAALPEWIQFVYLLETSPSLYTIERAQIGVEQPDSEMLKGQMRISRRVLLEGV